MTDKPLSPAAAAVRDAASNAQDRYWELMDKAAEDDVMEYDAIAAAALRAAADAIAPTQEDRNAVPEFHAQCVMNGMAYAVNELRGIADELEAGR